MRGWHAAPSAQGAWYQGPQAPTAWVLCAGWHIIAGPWRARVSTSCNRVGV